jgi:cell division control protein 45
MFPSLASKSVLTTLHSPFGLAFLEAKERCNARARHGSFDTSVLEVNKDDLNIFLQALCND